MTDVILREITAENWKACVELRVSDEQADFVPSNLYSIAEAQFYPRAVALAIYNEEERMVGFTMYGVDVARGSWKIFRLMIDAAHQRRGYGRAAMQQVIERLEDRPNCSEILICYKPANRAARRLYASLGFVEQEITTEKVVARLDLTQQRDEGGPAVRDGDEKGAAAGDKV